VVYNMQIIFMITSNINMMEQFGNYHIFHTCVGRKTIFQLYRGCHLYWWRKP